LASAADDLTGIQVAGLSSAADDLTGIQLVGLLGAADDLTGIQVAGLLGAADDLTGLQFAGLLGVADSLNGLQVSGLLSAAGNLTGIQFAGLWSAADHVKGIQVAGVVNRAKKVKGVQIAGLVNVADSSDYPIALVNIIKNGDRGIALSYDETGNTVVSFRSGGKGAYGVIGAGYNHNAGKRSFLIEGGWGVHINCSARFRINNELTTTGFIFYKNPTFKVGYYLHAAYTLLPHAEIFAGPSINYMQTHNDDHAAMFPGRALWKNDGVSKRQEVFIGYRAGVRYIF
jgi:hypothetical protein